MLRGAIWACAIPVGLGVIAMIMMFITMAPLISRGVAIHDNSLIGIAPIIACFIFGTPLTAWLACRSLAKISSADRLSNWKSSASRGFLNASLVHFIWASLYTIGVAFVMLKSQQSFFPDVDQGFSMMGGIFVTALVMNLMAWVIITLPLSLLCATVFWKVTKFPADTDVF